MLKQIPGFSDYMASDGGQIYSIRSRKYLCPSVTKFGYHRVTLYKDCKPSYQFVHRLVALAFLDEPENAGMQINHKDENKLNNHVSNLEWCTCSYNINYGSRNQIVSEKQIANKTRAVGRKVEQIDLLTGSVIKTWDSIRAIERELGFAHSNIASCCDGRRKTRGGFAWRYAEVDADGSHKQ